MAASTTARGLRNGAVVALLAVLFADLQTKSHFAELLGMDPDPGATGPFGRIEVIPGFFALEGTYNRGVTFGLAPGQTEAILLFTVLATVVSVPAEGRAVVDAGSKTLSSDALRPRVGGYGRILGRRSRLDKLSEEHGVIAVEEGDSFRVGERVRILPNHACVVANLHDRLVGTSGERVEAVLEVAGRGRVR